VLLGLTCTTSTVGGKLCAERGLAQIVVVVEDPLGLKNPDYFKYPLLLGSKVRVIIDGPVVDGVIAIPQEALREDSTVWILNGKDRLEVRDVVVGMYANGDVVISKGLQAGERVIVSDITDPRPGMSLRVE